MPCGTSVRVRWRWWGSPGTGGRNRLLVPCLWIFWKNWIVTFFEPPLFLLQLPDSQTLPVPPILLAELGTWPQEAHRVLLRPPGCAACQTGRGQLTPPVPLHASPGGGSVQGWLQSLRLFAMQLCLRFQVYLWLWGLDRTQHSWFASWFKRSWFSFIYERNYELCAPRWIKSQRMGVLGFHILSFLKNIKCNYAL